MNIIEPIRVIGTYHYNIVEYKGRSHGQITYSTSLMVILWNGICFSIACSCICREASRSATSHFRSELNLSLITSWQHCKEVE